jgi:hypothetical protein
MGCVTAALQTHQRCGAAGHRGQLREAPARGVSYTRRRSPAEERAARRRLRTQAQVGPGTRGNPRLPGVATRTGCRDPERVDEGRAHPCSVSRSGPAQRRERPPPFVRAEVSECRLLTTPE